VEVKSKDRENYESWSLQSTTGLKRLDGVDLKKIKQAESWVKF
jgi:hypothetical protein